MMIIGCAHQSTGGTGLKVYAEPVDPPCLKDKYNSLECSCKEVDILFIKWRRISEKYAKQANIFNGAGP
jgi:hypothetical protein